MNLDPLKTLSQEQFAALGDIINKAAFADALFAIANKGGLLPNHFNDVKAFHQKFGLMVSEQPRHLTRRKLKERVEFMLEELVEFASACGLEVVGQVTTAIGGDNFIPVGVIESPNCSDQDLAAQADALVDLAYVTLGTAVQLGLPWQALWDDVQRANMTKVRGTTKRGHAVDVTKPEGWVGPKGLDILSAHGYERRRYTISGESHGSVDEAKCHDDQ